MKNTGLCERIVAASAHVYGVTIQDLKSSGTHSAITARRAAMGALLRVDLPTEEKIWQLLHTAQ